MTAYSYRTILAPESCFAIKIGGVSDMDFVCCIGAQRQRTGHSSSRSNIQASHSIQPWPHFIEEMVTRQRVSKGNKEMIKYNFKYHLLTVQLMHNTMHPAESKGCAGCSGNHPRQKHSKFKELPD
jgi:hypothetical protein